MDKRQAFQHVTQDVYVARQPIFDENQELFAYELLFRQGHQSAFAEGMDGNQASSQLLINSFLNIGIANITGGHLAFVNFTRELLLGEFATVFPREQIVVELLEDIEPDEEVYNACRNLKQEGYLLAIDDFVFDEKYRRLFKLADIIKVDFTQVLGEERKKIIEKIGVKGMAYLAEKVETMEEFEQAKAFGYNLFQGYFFSKPVIIQGKDVSSTKMSQLRMMKEVNQPELNLEQLASVIQNDASLTYKLLRLVNSAFFGFRIKIESIKHALTLLGDQEVKKWANLTLMSGMGEDKPQELIVSALFRAKFCEMLATTMGRRNAQNDLFLMGLFSLTDVFIGRQMEEILSELPLDEQVKATLLGQESDYSDIFSLVLAAEQGNWEEQKHYLERLQLPEEEIPKLYLESVRSADQLLIGQKFDDEEDKKKKN